MAPGALSPPMTSTAARKNGSSGFSRRGLQPDLLFLVHLERKLRVHVAAVVAGGVGELGRAALGAADVVDRPQRVVGAALALAGLAVLLNGEHDDDSCAGRGKLAPGRLLKCLRTLAIQ